MKTFAKFLTEQVELDNPDRLWVYTCPYCKKNEAYNGIPGKGILFKGSAECHACGNSFCALGYIPVSKNGPLIGESVEMPEKKKELKTITVTCRDREGSLENLLKHIQKTGNVGHSFSIIVDPEGDDTQKFGWDGDGNDYIKDVSVK